MHSYLNSPPISLALSFFSVSQFNSQSLPPGKFLTLFCRLQIFYKINYFEKLFPGIPSQCQTVWIQIWRDILSGLIWVQTDCKNYQQTTLGDELKPFPMYHCFQFLFYIYIQSPKSSYFNHPLRNLAEVLCTDKIITTFICLLKIYNLLDIIFIHQISAQQE